MIRMIICKEEELVVSAVLLLVVLWKRWLCRLGYVVCSAWLGLMDFLVVWELEEIVWWYKARWVEY